MDFLNSPAPLPVVQKQQNEAPAPQKVLDSYLSDSHEEISPNNQHGALSSPSKDPDAMDDSGLFESVDESAEASPYGCQSNCGVQIKKLKLSLKESEKEKQGWIDDWHWAIKEAMRYKFPTINRIQQEVNKIGYRWDILVHGIRRLARLHLGKPCLEELSTPARINYLNTLSRSTLSFLKSRVMILMLLEAMIWDFLCTNILDRPSLVWGTENYNAMEILINAAKCKFVYVQIIGINY